MLNWGENTVLLLQTLSRPLVSLKYFTSFKVALKFRFGKKYYALKTYLEKLRKKMVILLF